MAILLYRLISPKVQDWITLNEPWSHAIEGYGLGVSAPGINNPGTDSYTAAHNQIRAHAKAYRAYNKDFKSKQQGWSICPVNILNITEDKKFFSLGI